MFHVKVEQRGHDLLILEELIRVNVGRRNDRKAYARQKDEKGVPPAHGEARNRANPSRKLSPSSHPVLSLMKFFKFFFSTSGTHKYSVLVLVHISTHKSTIYPRLYTDMFAENGAMEEANKLHFRNYSLLYCRFNLCAYPVPECRRTI